MTRREEPIPERGQQTVWSISGQKNQVKPINPVTPFIPKFGLVIPASDMWK